MFANVPMRKAAREIQDLSELEEVLRSTQVLRLGLTDGQWPYVVPLSFGYEPGAIYFHCAKEGHKLNLLRANPQVCFEVEDPAGKALPAPDACGWSASFRSVMGWGTAAILEDDAERAHGLEVVMRQHGFAGPMDFKALDMTCVVRISIGRMTGKRHHWPQGE